MGLWFLLGFVWIMFFSCSLLFVPFSLCSSSPLLSVSAASSFILIISDLVCLVLNLTCFPLVLLPCVYVVWVSPCPLPFLSAVCLLMTVFCCSDLQTFWTFYISICQKPACVKKAANKRRRDRQDQTCTKWLYFLYYCNSPEMTWFHISVV